MDKSDEFRHLWTLGAQGFVQVGEDGTRRWSRGDSEFILHVTAGKTYRVSVVLRTNGHIVAPENGLYLGDERIADLNEIPADGPLTGTFRAEGDTVTLTLRTKTWRPMDTEPGNGDVRDLGVSVHSITVVEEGQNSAPLYSANSGDVVAP